MSIAGRVRELVSPLANRVYRKVWLARLISEFGDWAARLALSLLILERTGSPALTGAIVGMTFLPWVGLGQYLATFGDRFDRRTVMVVADLARAATYLVIAAISGPTWLYFPLAFLASAFDAPFQASRSAVLVNVNSEEAYPNALRLETITAQTATMAGLLAGGGFSAALGPRGALAANAITFVVSALVLTRLPRMRTETDRKPSVRDGLRVLQDGFIRRAVSTVVLVTVPATALETQLPVFGERIAMFDPLMIGALAVTVPAGTIATTLIVRSADDDHRLLRIGSMIAVLAGGAIAVAFSLGAGGIGMWIGFVFCGVAFGCTVPTNVVAGRRIPNEIRSSAFGFLQGLILVGFGIGSFVGGALAELVGVEVAMVYLGAAILVFGAVMFVAPVGVAAPQESADTR